MRFSERIGKRATKNDFQLESMDNDLKNGVWNIVANYIVNPLLDDTSSYHSFKSLIFSIWFSFYKEPIDLIKYGGYDFTNDLRYRYYSKWDFLDIYDFIDFIVKQEQSILPFSKAEFINTSNFILKREMSGYRFINNQLAPITNENEIVEIEKAIDNTSGNVLRGAHIHLTEALNKLSDRKHPDYRNSIKESISSIESICQVISKDNRAELGKALKILKTTIPIHGALEQGLLKIYGYTSDGEAVK